MSYGMPVPELEHVGGCIREIPITYYLTEHTLSFLKRANTMSTALEVLGMTLPYSAGIPAVYPGKSCDRDETCEFSF